MTNGANPVRTQTILSALLLGTFAFAAGCNGPTQSGIKARAEAHDRMNLVNAQVAYDQARQAFETGQFEKAAREIRNAIARYDKLGEYYLLQGRICVETHQLEKALESFQTAMEKKADYADAHYFAGIVYQRWSDDEQAYREYRDAYDIEPTRAQFLLAAAETLISLGEFDAASELIAPRLDYFEHNAAIKQLQGQIALLKGDARKATEMYAEARLLDPDNDMLLEDLMWAQYAAQQYGQCHESAKLLQSRAKEERFDLLHLEARCLVLMGRGVEGREAYVKLTKMRPADVSVWSESGTLAWDLGDYRRLAACSVQLISLAPERYEGYMFKGINEQHNDRDAEAISLFRQAAERSTDSALPHLLLGQALEKQGDMKGAKLAYNAALQVEPSSGDARQLLTGASAGDRGDPAPIDR